MPLVGVGTAQLQAMTTSTTCAPAAVVGRRVSSGAVNASRCVCAVCVFKCGIERIALIERESKRAAAWLSVTGQGGVCGDLSLSLAAWYACHYMDLPLTALSSNNVSTHTLRHTNPNARMLTHFAE
jgi:hypothetical protein